MRHASTFAKGLLVVLCAAWLISISSVSADFSAERYRGMPRRGDTPVLREKLYVKGNMERRETRRPHEVEVIPASRWKPNVITIYIPEKGILWVIDPESKTYKERYFTPVKDSNPLKGWKYVGTEQVNGFKCGKYTRKSSFPQRKFTTTQWWSTKLKYTIKTTSSRSTFRTRMTQELKNIVVKPLPDSLFQPPKGYKKVSNGSKKSLEPKTDEFPKGRF